MADQKQTLATNLLATCRTLDDVDLRLRIALKARGYTQLSYFQTPGGFAIVTQLEQFNPDRRSFTGASRWTDYPVQDDFNSLWQYLQALAFPKKSSYRIFVFLVSDTPFTMSKTRVAKEEAARWLSLGLNILPPEVGKTPVTAKHHLDALVYEFSVQDSEKIAPKRLTPRDTEEHLSRSGLKEVLREQKLIGE